MKFGGPSLLIHASRKGEPMNDQVTSTPVTVERVTLHSTKPFETVREALDAAVPPLDHTDGKLLLDGRVDEASDVLERQAPLSVLGMRDHGGLLLTAGLTRKAIQYDIGNPLTASRMARHVLAAALYAPIRVLLREDAEGKRCAQASRAMPTSS